MGSSSTTRKQLAQLKILKRLAAERHRQEALNQPGELTFCLSMPHITWGGKMMVLAEKFGDVAKAAYEGYSKERTRAEEVILQTELIQLAAVAAAWAESLE